MQFMTFKETTAVLYRVASLLSNMMRDLLDKIEQHPCHVKDQFVKFYHKLRQMIKKGLFKGMQ